MLHQRRAVEDGLVKGSDEVEESAAAQGAETLQHHVWAVTGLGDRQADDPACMSVALHFVVRPCVYAPGRGSWMREAWHRQLTVLVGMAMRRIADHGEDGDDYPGSGTPR